MDMTNATQAGPSQGLLDLLFGAADKESSSPDSADSDPIAALVKALEKQSAEIKDSANNFLALNNMMAQNSAVTQNNASDAKPVTQEDIAKKIQNDPKVLEILGGNLALVALLSKIQPNADAVSNIKNNDNTAILKLIEGRKDELKKQMPSLELLEKKIQKDGMDTVVALGSVAKLVEQLEAQQNMMKKQPAGLTAHDFMQTRNFSNNMKNKETGNNDIAQNTITTSSALMANELTNNGNLDASNNFQNSKHALSNNSRAVENIASMAPTDKMLNAQLNNSSHNNSNLFSENGHNESKTNFSNEIKQEFANNNILSMDPSKSAVMSGIGGSMLLSGSKEGYFNEATVDVNSPSLRTSLMPKVAHNIVFMAKNGVDELNMTIFPRDLGEVQLKVSSKGQTVNVQIITQNNDVALTIRNSSNELIDALKSQNLQVGGFEVSVRPDKVLLADGGSSLSNNGFSGFGNSSDQGNWNNGQNNAREAFQNFSQNFQQNPQQQRNENLGNGIQNPNIPVTNGTEIKSTTEVSSRSKKSDRNVDVLI